MPFNAFNEQFSQPLITILIQMVSDLYQFPHELFLSFFPHFFTAITLASARDDHVKRHLLSSKLRSILVIITLAMVSNHVRKPFRKPKGILPIKSNWLIYEIIYYLIFHVFQISNILKWIIPF